MAGGSRSVHPESEQPPRAKAGPTDAPVPEDDFTRAYREVVSRLFRPLRARDGFPEADVAAAEKALGVRLPPPLRAVERIAGRFQRLHQTYYSLCELPDLEVVGGALEFYYDPPSSMRWGIRLEDLSQEDPPVCQSPVRGEVTWVPDHPRLSDFLLMMVYLQASEGGLAHVGVTDVTPDAVRRIAEQWPLVSDGGGPDSGLRVYSEGAQVLCLYLDRDGSIHLQAGGKTRQDFDAIGTRLGIEMEEC